MFAIMLIMPVIHQLSCVINDELIHDRACAYIFLLANSDSATIIFVFLMRTTGNKERQIILTKVSLTWIIV